MRAERAVPSGCSAKQTAEPSLIVPKPASLHEAISQVKPQSLIAKFAEGLGVVAALKSDLRQRDTEVAGLYARVNTKRSLGGGAGDQACMSAAF